MKQVASPKPGRLSGASNDHEGKAREVQAWSHNPKRLRYRKSPEKASFNNTSKLLELAAPAEAQKQPVGISHQDNASQTGTIVIHEEVIGIPAPPLHRLRDQEVTDSRWHSERGRLWESGGPVWMAPPVIGSSKTE